MTHFAVVWATDTKALDVNFTQCFFVQFSQTVDTNLIPGDYSEHIIKEFKKLRRLLQQQGESQIKIELCAYLICIAIIPCWSRSTK